jgi:hypothetical protein
MLLIKSSQKIKIYIKNFYFSDINFYYKLALHKKIILLFKKNTLHRYNRLYEPSFIDLIYINNFYQILLKTNIYHFLREKY